MKFLTPFLLLSISAAIPAIEVDQPKNSDPFVLYLANQQNEKSFKHPKLLSMRLEFLEWGRRFGKVYKSMKEEMERMLIWIENHEFIENHNNQVPKPSYTVGHNNFSDLTNDEFQKLHSIGKYSPGVEVIREGHKKSLEKSAMRKIQNGLRVDEDYPEQVEFRYLRNLAASGGEDSLDMEGDWLFTDDLWDMDFEDIKQKGAKLDRQPLLDDEYDDDYDDDSVEPSSDDNDTKGLPDEIDWVTAGAVTPVKNQKACGSCWAFSATGAIEGASFVKYGELINLSEQNLIDCDTTDHGCGGGIMEDAFKYDETAHGLCSEFQYPYVGVQGYCNSTCAKVPTSVVADYLDIDEGDKHGLLASLVLQPTSIAMQADQLGFQFYTSGVFSEESCGEEGAIDHGVLAVGYGTDEVTGKKYFKVKNSWGEDWGESGYFRLDRESKNQWGTCAILMIMTAPIMA